MVGGGRKHEEGGEGNVVIMFRSIQIGAQLGQIIRFFLMRRRLRSDIHTSIRSLTHPLSNTRSH